MFWRKWRDAINKSVPASVLRLVGKPDKQEDAFAGRVVANPANDTGSQPEQDPLVILRRNFLKHMALCNAYDDLPDIPENAELDGDAESDAAEDLRRASFYLQPSSIHGILACLEWFREDFEHFHINEKPSPDWADCWGLKMLEGSISALQQMAEKQAA